MAARAVCDFEQGASSPSEVGLGVARGAARKAHPMQRDAFAHSTAAQDFARSAASAGLQPEAGAGV